MASGTQYGIRGSPTSKVFRSWLLIKITSKTSKHAQAAHVGPLGAKQYTLPNRAGFITVGFVSKLNCVTPADGAGISLLGRPIPRN